MPATPRFLTLPDVAEVLNVTVRQTYALVRSGDLRGIQVGGRGQWRIENSELEDYIDRQYARTDATVSETPGDTVSETPDGLVSETPADIASETQDDEHSSSS